LNQKIDENPWKCHDLKQKILEMLASQLSAVGHRDEFGSAKLQRLVEMQGQTCRGSRGRRPIATLWTQELGYGWNQKRMAIYGYFGETGETEVLEHQFWEGGAWAEAKYTYYNA